jgi:putative addiction module component (TIGR02574 family)
MVYAFFMTTTAAAFKLLPVSERIQLVEDIWDSIAEETSDGSLQLTASEQVELNARYAAHLSDPQSSVPWSEVKAALFKERH